MKIIEQDFKRISKKINLEIPILKALVRLEGITDLDIFVELINMLVENNWIRFLQMKDWTKFAEYFVGRLYVHNHYDIKLATTYQLYKTQTV